MTLAVFLAIMALSLGIALWSRRGHGQQGARAFFTASGQFGAVLFFFLSVGETYSIASMLGFPGGVYDGGDAFVLWFFGYILLACCCIYFLGPWIWRAGRLYGSATIPDFFRDHWGSRPLELLIAITSIILLLPIGTMQFTGLRLVLGGLAPEARPVLLTGAAGLLCFAYVVIAGLRASAFVAVLKDLLMMGSILLVGGLAIADWQAVPAVAQAVPAPAATQPDMVFAISTILLQAVGFTMIPQNWAFLFSAKNPQAIRRAQVAAPLYMLMFPLLMATATYAQGHGIVPSEPDYVFLAVAEVLLHPAAMGLVMAAVALSGLVILSSVCLAIGPLVTRNLAPNLGSAAQQRWSRWVVAAFLLLSLLSAESGGTLMARLNNLFYFGVVQTLPGFIAALLLPRVPVAAVIGGIVAGDGLVLALWLGNVPVGGLNLGVIGLAANIAVLAGVTLLRPRNGGRSVVSAVRAGEA
ncbi:sodium:solute symporter family protein [Croceibacterium ferulae]|uniref:sodium:solute symporter family protein n=1 Tax=Croceibacterium ferulae TaxID=1854641 RepID=UPI000EAC63FB|nr:sodium:solute symporter [Croceibacterium ferulae]